MSCTSEIYRQWAEIAILTKVVVFWKYTLLTKRRGQAGDHFVPQYAPFHFKEICFLLSSLNAFLKLVSLDVSKVV